MIKEGKFGPHEAICLTTIAISAKAFFTSPSIIANILGTTGWLMTLISAGTAMLGFSFIYLLLKRFPDKDIVEIFEISLGRILGFMFAGALALSMIFVAATRMREFTEVLKVYVLPLSPPSFILGIFVIGAAIMCLLGLETIARFAKLSAYALLLSFILVLALGWKNYDIHRIFPILGYGAWPLVHHGLIRSSAYGEVVILSVIAGSLQGTKYIKRVGFISLVLSGLIISASILAFTLTFPYYTAKEVTSPMYQMTTLIDYGRFFQRIDPVFLFVWNISTFISVIIVFYAFLSIYCKMFRIQDMRPAVIPSTIILFALSMIPRDMASIVFRNVQGLRSYGWVIFYILPLITLIIAKIRKKGQRKEGEQNA
ncbi:MAG: spore germination protein [Actinobacteria bacterium]|nr:spore germination protein [Actinomycetota bacterium]